MFGIKTDKEKIIKLEARIDELVNDLDTAEADRDRLTEFYESTQAKELTRLEKKVVTLEAENVRLRDAREAARIQLEGEFNDKIKQVAEDYQRKLELEIDSNAKKLELIEAQITTEVTNRIKEGTSDIEIRAKQVELERKHEKEMHDIYKEKFKSGKVELGADEIKGMLLSANPNGQKILENMGAFNK